MVRRCNKRMEFGMKIILNQITEKRIYMVMLIVFLLSVVPILMLAFYNYPCADDFSASDTAYWAWKSTGSILAVIKAAWENVVYNYMEWSGVFMSVFWTSLQFGIFGERFYGIVTWIAVALFIVSGFYLGYVIFTKYLKVNKYMAGCVIILYLFTSIQCMPDGNEGLYWHAGVVNYTWAFAFCLMLLAVVLSSFREENPKKRILKTLTACLLAICVGGGNYLTALQSSLWLLFVLVLFLFYTVKNRKEKFVVMMKKNLCGILPIVVLWLSFAVSVLAPGNKVRMSESVGLSPVKAVLVSFEYFLKQPIEDWLCWPVIVLLALAIPFMWHLAEESSFSFCYPGAVAFLAFCFVSAAFTPNLYAQGTVGGGRLADTIFFIWIFVLYALTFYVVGWLQKIIQKEKRVSLKGISERSKVYILGMTCFWLMCSALTVMINEDTYIGSLAGDSIMTGQAELYRVENENRLRLLYDNEVEKVVFQGFYDPPRLLLFQDITCDENDWLNQVMAEYYGKESVRRE